MTPYLPSGSPPTGARVVPSSAIETALRVSAPPILASVRARDFVSLTKPRVVLMIVLTTAVAYHLGSTARPNWMQLWHTLAGTALAAGGTLALNQFLERVSDALMLRTQDRPLPSGRLTPNEALWFGGLALVMGLGYLTIAVGWLAGAVTLVTAS